MGLFFSAPRHWLPRADRPLMQATKPEYYSEDESARNRNCAIGAVAIVIGYLIIFAGDGLFAYFTPDDMMNLYGAWFRPVIEADRPMGAIFYRGLFAAFGLNPLPYRIGCLLLLLINLGLLYAFCFHLSRSREVAALACLLGAYHAHLADLYYSTGTVYDLLCGVFYLAAFVYYARVRLDGHPPGWRQMLLFLLLYISALSAKEMAVTLPMSILLYDLLYHPPKRASESVWRWVVREARILGPAIMVTGALFIRKTAGPVRMIGNPDYQPHLAWSSFMAAWKHYAFDLFYGTVKFNQFRIVLLWAVLMGIAWITRRRALLYAFAFLFLGILPVAFIPPRGFFAIYLTLPGWYLFAATGLVLARDALGRRFHLHWCNSWTNAPEAAVFIGVALILFPLHWREKPLGRRWVAEAHASVRSVAAPLRKAADPLPLRARVLFLSDPFPKDDWILTFIFRLHYRDDGIRVDRVKAMRVYPDQVAQTTYDRIFRMDGSTLTMLPLPLSN